MAESIVRLKDTPHGQGRVVFRGTHDDAEKYLADNFPRIHAEPGTDYGDEGPVADARVIHPDEVPDDKVSGDGVQTGGAFE